MKNSVLFIVLYIVFCLLSVNDLLAMDNYDSEILVEQEKTYFQTATIYRREGVLKQLLVSGNHYQMGLQHGVLLKNEIIQTEQFVNKLITMIASDKNIPKELIKIYLEMGIKRLEKSVPDRLKEEIRGISDGSGVKLNTIYMINLLGDFLAVQGCSGVIIKDKYGKSYHGRSMDLPWGEDWPEPVIISYSPTGYNNFSSITYAGYVGSETSYSKYFSFSQNSIFVKKINKNGTPYYMLNRIAIEECKTSSEVVEFFKKNRSINGEKGFYNFPIESRQFIMDINPLSENNLHLIETDKNILWGINLYDSNEYSELYQDNSFIMNGNNLGRKIIFEKFEDSNKDFIFDYIFKIFRSTGIDEDNDFALSYHLKGINNSLTTHVVIFAGDNSGVYVSTGTTFAGSNKFYFYSNDPGVQPELFLNDEPLSDVTVLLGNSSFKLDNNVNLYTLYKNLSDKYRDITAFKLLYAIKAIDIKRYDESIKILSTISKDYSEYNEVLVEIANILYKRFRFNEAKEKLLKVDPEKLKIIKYILLYNDLKKRLNLSKDKTNINYKDYFHALKLRGGLNWTVIYHPGYQYGKAQNGITPIDYTTVDYTDKGDPYYKNHSKGDPGMVLGNNTGLPETMVLGFYELEVPLLRSEHFLLSSNNLKTAVVTTITPVTVNTGLEISLTPVAFFTVFSGIYIGTGWNIPGLAYGLARFNYNGFYNGESIGLLENENFYSGLLRTFIGGRLQLDLSEIMNEKYKRWTHILFEGSFRLTYTSLLKEMSNISNPYIFENSITFNGFSMQSSFFLGYKIPVVIDSRKDIKNDNLFLNYVRHNSFDILLLFWCETHTLLTQFNFSKISDKGWGSDFTFFRFGPMINFNMPNNFFIVFSFNWATSMVFSVETIGNANPLNKEVVGLSLYYDRFLVTFGWRF